jgi:hypothetical protein
MRQEPARREKERERGDVCKEGAWRQLEKPEQRACATGPGSSKHLALTQAL